MCKSFDKSRTSLLVNGSENLPKSFRNALSIMNLNEKIKEGCADFAEEHLRIEELPVIVEEITKIIMEDDNIKDKDRFLREKDNINSFMACVLLESIKQNNVNYIINDNLIRNGSYCVDVIYGDLFRYAFRNRSKKKNIVVIPVDTEFHTHVTRKYENSSKPEVSEKTIHGQWLIRWEQSGEKLDDLPERIRKSIKSLNLDSKRIRYPIGTIAIIESNNTIFYLLAISDFDSNNNARSTRGNIDKVIEELADFYDKHGDGLDIYIPLIGTGKSRAALSLQESYDGIVNYYRENNLKIQGNIHIVIQKDYEKFINIQGGK